jgi:hypothetical protein
MRSPPKMLLSIPYIPFAVFRWSLEWWKDKGFVEELDRRYEALEAGTDKGFTVDQLATSIDKLRKKRYGK